MDTSKQWLQMLQISQIPNFKQLLQKYNQVQQTDDDPLAETSSYSAKFENDQLRQVITLDVKRTFPDFDYFRREDTHTLMVDILFVWCKANCSRDQQDYGYVQGYHEILAPILFVLHQEQSENVQQTAYALFSAILKKISIYYERPVKVVKQSQALFSNGDVVVQESPLLKLCSHIQHELLSVLEPTLYQLFQHHRIEPQLYGIRWIKLLFAREVPFDQVPQLWTALIADDFKLVEWVAVSLLGMMKDRLLEDANDSSSVLKALMQPQSCQDVQSLIELAYSQRDQFKELVQKPEVIHIPAQSVSPIQVLQEVRRNVVSPIFQTVNDAVFNIGSTITQLTSQSKQVPLKRSSSALNLQKQQQVQEPVMSKSMHDIVELSPTAKRSPSQVALPQSKTIEEIMKEVNAKEKPSRLKDLL